MLTEDLERSLLKHLTEKLPDGLAVHRPGEAFSPERQREWIEPRIARIDREPQSKPGEEVDRLTLVTRCFVKVLQKGKRGLSLSQLVDKVRAVLDSTLLAPAGIVRDEDGTDIGRLQFGPADEARRYGVSVEVGGVPVQGLDVAVLSTPTLITGDP